RRIWPGRYIVAEPASVTRPSTVDHVQFVGLSAWMLVGAVKEPTWRMRPPGSTNMNGYDGIQLVAENSGVQLFDATWYSSGTCWTTLLDVPDVARMSPFWIRVAVGYQRR